MTTDPFDEIADVAESAVRTLNDPAALKARLAKLENNDAAAAADRLRELATDDPRRFNELYDARDPELMQLLEKAHGYKEESQ